MNDTLHSFKPWVTFAGGVLVILVLYWAQAVLVPIALALLLTFVLTPPVTRVRGLLVARSDPRPDGARPRVWLLSAPVGARSRRGADLIEQHIKTEAPRSVYDALLLPALNYAERDRLEQRLSADEEAAVIDATQELLSDAAESIRRLQAEPSPPDDPTLPGPREPLRVLGFATNGVGDELALKMLGHLLDNLPIVVEITKGRVLASELVALVRAQGVSVVCLADLPPSPVSKTRYLVKRLHAALPDVRILVGRWGPPPLADESTQPLRDAGATLVASTLAEIRTYLVAAFAGDSVRQPIDDRVCLRVVQDEVSTDKPILDTVG